MTDRCNFRCRYCLPREAAPPFLERKELLTFEELVVVAGVFRVLGARKFRLTGGEPLLRRGLPRLIEKLQPLGAELALTTNGTLLEQSALELRRAGLERLTVSLDSLDERQFQALSDAPGFSSGGVLRGIERAAEVGFSNIKINCVLKRSVNFDQVFPLLDHFKGRGIVVRFIEYMDVGTLNAWRREEVVRTAEVQALLEQRGSLVPLGALRVGEVAQRYTFDGQEIGFISSVSDPFCGDCGRVRLSAEGRLFGCLFAAEGLDLKGVLRGQTAELLEERIREFWKVRADRYSELRAGEGPERSKRLPLLTSRAQMSYLGG